MIWEQILGFFTMWPNPGVTIGLWAKAGVPIWQTISYVVLLTSISLSLTYFGTGWLENFLIKKGVIRRTTIKKWRNWLERNNNLSRNEFHERLRDRIKSWLIPQKSWKILAWGFVPFIPVLPTVIIMATRLLEIRNGFLALILGNIFRNGILCCTIYLIAYFFS